MARCIAKISGDGYLYYRYIRYSNQCRELVDEFKQDILKEFGNVKITEGISNSGTPFAQIHGKRIINCFLDYLKDYRSFYIFIPEKIINSSLGVKRQFIRAFYDDEGSPSLRLSSKHMEWKRSISLCSNSYRILQEIKNILLNNFDIPSNRIIRNKPDSEEDRSYLLFITGRVNIVNFRNRIGFLHPTKKRKIDLIIESYGCGYIRNKEGFYWIFDEYNNLMKKKRTAFCGSRNRVQYNTERRPA